MSDELDLGQIEELAAPPPEVTVEAAPAQGISFNVTGWPTSYIGTLTCRHGVTRSQVFTVSGGPNAAKLKLTMFDNHDRLIRCVCTTEPIPSVATVTLGQSNAIARGVTRILAPLGVTLTGSGFVTLTGKLLLVSAGTVQIAVAFNLGRSVADGAQGVGRIWVNGASIASAPLTDVGGKAMANVSYSGLVPAGATIEAAFTNNSGLAQEDVQSGGTITASLP